MNILFNTHSFCYKCLACAHTLIDKVQSFFIHAFPYFELTGIHIHACKCQFKQIMPELYNSSTYVVDAVWALAHAVNNCISTIGSVGICGKEISRFISNSRTCKVCMYRTISKCFSMYAVTITVGELYQW